MIAVVFIMGISVFWLYGCPAVESMEEVLKQSSKAIIEVAFICAFVAFFDGNIRFFSVDNLGKKVKFYLRVFLGCMICLVIVAFLVRKLTSFRNAILEVLKVFVLLTFSLFYYQKMNLKEESQPQKDNAIKTLIRVLFVDVVIFLAGFLAGEFGTALILSLFVFLLILFVFSSMSEERSGKKNLGKVLAWSIAIFILIFLLLYFLCYSIYLKDSTLTIGLKNLGLYDKLDRIFNLSGNVQIEEMNTAINESPRLFVALPYNVSLAGMIPDQS